MAKGAAWLLVLRLCDRAVGLASTLVLARLLVPADFGLVAMATSVLAALELLSAFSFDMALIQNQQAQRRHYDTAWSMAVAFGVLNAIAMCALAIPAARFYGDPRVESLMYALALAPLIQGFQNVGVVAFQKELELHKEFWFKLSRRMLGFAVTMALAFHLRNYWALVAGTVVSCVLGLALSYLLHAYRPQLTFVAWKELINFSKWLLLNNLLIFANNRGTDYLVGHFNGARALGLYSVSYEVANLPTTEMVWPVQRAVFPGYAKLAGSPERLRSAFQQVLALVALVAVPAGAGISLLADPIVRLLLGLQWLDAIALIEILALFGIVRSLHGPTGSVFVAIGKPRLIAFSQCIQLACALSLMVYLIPMHGAKGAAWSILLAAVAAACTNFAMTLRQLSMRIDALLSVLWRPLVAAGVMASALSWARMGVATGADTVSIAVALVVSIALGASVYLSCVGLLWILSGRPESAEAHLLAYIQKALRRRAQRDLRGT